MKRKCSNGNDIRNITVSTNLTALLCSVTSDRRIVFNNEVNEYISSCLQSVLIDKLILSINYPVTIDHGLIDQAISLKNKTTTTARKKKKKTRNQKKKENYNDVRGRHTEIALLKEISFCFDLYLEETVQEETCNRLLLFILPINTFWLTFPRSCLPFSLFCYYLLT